MSVSIIGSAQESNDSVREAPPAVMRLSYICTTITSLGISNKQADTLASVSGYQGITTKVTITVTLQKKGVLGLYWSDVASWTKTFNDYKGTLAPSYGVGSGTYRVCAVYTAYSGSASETITGYSSNVKA